MKEKMKLLKNKRVLVSLCVLILVIIGLAIWQGGETKKTHAVGRSDVVESVSATGVVKAAKSVELGFDRSGRVASVPVEIGDLVRRGAVIATLEYGDVEADLQKARAEYNEELLNLGETSKVAPADYDTARANLTTAIANAHRVVDNTIHNKVDRFYTDTGISKRFQVTFTNGSFTHYFKVDTETELMLNAKRSDAERILANMKASPDADEFITSLRDIGSFLDAVAAAVNSFTPADYAYTSSVSEYKSLVSGARADINTSLEQIIAAKEKLNQAPLPNSLGTFQNIARAKEKVNASLATVAGTSAELGKYVIRAPFDGVVTVADAKAGGSVTAGQIYFAMQSQGDEYIETNVSEVHIGKILPNNKVMVDFDAIKAGPFVGKVTFIEPGNHLVDGVVNYRVRVKLDTSSEDIKPFLGRLKVGMTANLKIVTASRANVVAIPSYALVDAKSTATSTSNAVSKVVRRVIGETVEELSPQLGLKGSNGFVEVLGGLAEGDVLEY